MGPSADVSMKGFLVFTEKIYETDDSANTEKTRPCVSYTKYLLGQLFLIPGLVSSVSNSQMSSYWGSNYNYLVDNKLVFDVAQFS